MLQTLQHWDVSLFQLINGSLSNPIFDALLPWFREKWFWMPLYLFIVAFSGLNFKGRGWVIVVGMVLAASLSDFTSSTLVKKRFSACAPAMILKWSTKFSGEYLVAAGTASPPVTLPIILP